MDETNETRTWPQRDRRIAKKHPVMPFLNGIIYIGVFSRFFHHPLFKTELISVILPLMQWLGPILYPPGSIHMLVGR